MSSQGVIAPGSGARAAAATLVRRSVLGSADDRPTTTGEFALPGISRITVSGRLSATSTVGGRLVVEVLTQGDLWDEIDEFALAAVNTTYSSEIHVAGARMRVRAEGFSGDYEVTVLLRATGTS